jgi:VIT1/CCC1 family predicted Fe2+/Mn2+ transporter
MTEPAVEEIGHTHADVSGGWLRPAVFGAMDGLVTNIALVAGVGGAGADRRVIILAGMASLVAGAFSMALGEFTSVDTQNNAVEAEVQVEREELRKHPEAEEAELVEMYMDMGLSRPTATVLALALGLTVGGVGLFTAGALVSRFTARSWWFNGIRQLAFGAIAAGATYVVGALIGVSAVG